MLGRVFPATDATIVLLGENRGELGGSSICRPSTFSTARSPPTIDLKQERALQTLLPARRETDSVGARHLEGGFAALAECCFGDTGGRGADVGARRFERRCW